MIYTTVSFDHFNRLIEDLRDFSEKGKRVLFDHLQSDPTPRPFDPVAIAEDWIELNSENPQHQTAIINMANELGFNDSGYDSGDTLFIFYAAAHYLRNQTTVIDVHYDNDDNNKENVFRPNPNGLVYNYLIKII